MTVRQALGKINLGLEVIGRRPDGFHNIVSVVQTLELHDTLEFRPSAFLRLSCNRPDLETENNLVLRAATLLRERYGVESGAAIRLEKRVPVAAGLGGGSSDAAATLLGLSDLWGLALGDEELATLAARLGADVPFFLHGGTALIERIGERVTPLPRLAPHWVVLALPPVDIPQKTRTLYARLTPTHYRDGSVTRRLAQQIAAGMPLDAGLLVNTFEAVLTEEPVQACRQAMLEAGAPWVHLSGSGPSLFCLFESEEQARAMLQRLRAGGVDGLLTRTGT